MTGARVLRACLAAGLLLLAHPLSAEPFTDSAGRTVMLPTTVNKVRNTTLSLWYAQISLRYQF